MGQLSLWLMKTNQLERPAPDVTGYPCPGCDRKVVDKYVEGDALCCWCRDIDDPRLAHRIRKRRLGRLS